MPRLDLILDVDFTDAPAPGWPAVRVNLRAPDRTMLSYGQGETVQAAMTALAKDAPDLAHLYSMLTR